MPHDEQQHPIERVLRQMDDWSAWREEATTESIDTMPVSPAAKAAVQRGMTEAAALENARADALNLAVDLEEIAAALRVCSLGRAHAGDATLVRGAIDAHGDLVVRGQLAWDLLLRHAAEAAL